jgi:hypothetical protein
MLRICLVLTNSDNHNDSTVRLVSAFDFNQPGSSMVRYNAFSTPSVVSLTQSCPKKVYHRGVMMTVRACHMLCASMTPRNGGKSSTSKRAAALMLRTKARSTFLQKRPMQLLCLVLCSGRMWKHVGSAVPESKNFAVTGKSDRTSLQPTTLPITSHTCACRSHAMARYAGSKVARHLPGRVSSDL